jgi:pimeloyl-ACP methyl ester carboxylesterase
VSRGVVISGEESADAISPCRIEVPQVALDDLQERLGRTRWPEDLPDAGWSRGVPPAYLKELAGYWENGYDWREHEARLNRFPQFTTRVDGQDIHFLHVRSAAPDAAALLVLHGWPGSVVELIDIIEPLAGTFHVVAPSLPGFGFSGPVRDAGWNVPRIAAALAGLLDRLGYQRFGAHGGDWGAIIAREMGRAYPDRLTGVHLTMLPSATPVSPPEPAELAALSEAERDRVEASMRRRAHAFKEELGYGILQSTRPRTIGYALTDSPVGQLAWIAEKFEEWTDVTVDRDQLLTNVTVYWLTGTAGSAAGLYYEAAHTEAGMGAVTQPSRTPTGVASFPRDTALPVRHLAERTDNIVHWSEFERGGHFPAMEVPDLLVDDIRRFFTADRDDREPGTAGG